MRPQLAAVLDRLERDHRVVSELLDDIEAAALDLHDTTRSAARTDLADALSRLSEHLLEHLHLEEQALAPVLQTWRHWPESDLLHLPGLQEANMIYTNDRRAGRSM